MRNITAAWRERLQNARADGDRVVLVPVESVERLVEHLMALDRVFIAAETLTNTVVPIDEWLQEERDAFAHLKKTVKEATSC